MSKKTFAQAAYIPLRMPLKDLESSTTCVNTLTLWFTLGSSYLQITTPFAQQTQAPNMVTHCDQIQAVAEVFFSGNMAVK
jgi:hypothetical protein